MSAKGELAAGSPAPVKGIWKGKPVMGLTGGGGQVGTSIGGAVGSADTDGAAVAAAVSDADAPRVIDADSFADADVVVDAEASGESDVLYDALLEKDVLSEKEGNVGLPLALGETAGLPPDAPDTEATREKEALPDTEILREAETGALPDTDALTETEALFAEEAVGEGKGSVDAAKTPCMAKKAAALMSRVHGSSGKSSTRRPVLGLPAA